MIVPQEYFLGLSNDNPQGAQGFGCTGNFAKQWNNSVYCRLRKIAYGFKDQARTRHPGEKCGLAGQQIKGPVSGRAKRKNRGQICAL